MINFNFQEPDYQALLHQLANNFKCRLTDNLLLVPPAFGSGYIWAEKLPMGMTILVADVTMNQENTFSFSVETDQYYSLQFDEYGVEKGGKGKTAYQKPGSRQQSAVKLHNTSTPQVLSMPRGLGLKTVRFYFSASQLGKLMGEEAMEAVLTKYFPQLMAQERLEPIETNYRETLNELLVKKFTVPLKLNFIQNRVFLLFEKFILKLGNHKENTSGKAKRIIDDEQQLIKIESLLVESYIGDPPTIDELSRISAMCPTKLKNDFKRMYGSPIFGYRQKNRMLKAKTLLLTGKYTIQEVGNMVGYTNLSHFAKSFKKEFEILPSELGGKDGVLVYNS